MPPLLLRSWLVSLAGACLLLSVAPGAEAIRIGPPRPVCDEITRLEGAFYMEVFDANEAATRYVRVQAGRTDPVVLYPDRTYRLVLRAGATPTAPVIPAFYRLEPRSFLTLTAHGEGEEVLPLEREFSINAIEDLRIETREHGRRKLFLRLSECYKGGSRYFHHPNETLVPLVVVPPPDDEAR